MRSARCNKKYTVCGERVRGGGGIEQFTYGQSEELKYFVKLKSVARKLYNRHMSVTQPDSTYTSREIWSNFLSQSLINSALSHLQFPALLTPPRTEWDRTIWYMMLPQCLHTTEMCFLSSIGAETRWVCKCCLSAWDTGHLLQFLPQPPSAEEQRLLSGVDVSPYLRAPSL